MGLYDGYPRWFQDMQEAADRDSLRWPSMQGQWSKDQEDNALKWVWTWKMANDGWSSLSRSKNPCDAQTVVLANLPFELPNEFWFHHLETIEKRNDNGQWESAGVRVRSIGKGGQSQLEDINSRWYKVVLDDKVMVDAVILALHGRTWNLSPLQGPFPRVKVIPWPMWDLDMTLLGSGGLCKGRPPWNRWGPYAAVSPAIVWESWQILQINRKTCPSWTDMKGNWTSLREMVIWNNMDSLPYAGGFLCGPRQAANPMTSEAIRKCSPVSQTIAEPAVAPLPLRPAEAPVLPKPAPPRPLPPSEPPRPTRPVPRGNSPPPPTRPVPRGNSPPPPQPVPQKVPGPPPFPPEEQSAAERAAAREALRQELLANAAVMMEEMTRLQELMSSIMRTQASATQASAAAGTSVAEQANRMSSGTSDLAAAVPTPAPDSEAASGPTETSGKVQANAMSSGSSGIAAAVPAKAIVHPAWPPPNETERAYWTDYQDEDAGHWWSHYDGPLGEWYYCPQDDCVLQYYAEE